MIDPGKLKDVAIVEQPGAQEADDDGGYSQAWTEIDRSPVFGSFQSSSARVMERLAGQNAEVSSATHVFETHYHDGITTAMRLRIGARVFAIRGVQNVDEADEMTRLFVEEVQRAAPPGWLQLRNEWIQESFAQ